MNHQYKIRCTLDQPIQRLMQKLSSKSTDLYIFWQNYNQMYTICNDRYIEIQMLRQQLQRLKRQRSNYQKNYGPSQSQYNILKQKVWSLQKANQDYKNDNDRLRKQMQQLLLTNQKINEQNRHFQSLIKQFRDQNFIQKQNIDNILQRLRDTQFNIHVNNQKVNMEQINQMNRKLKNTEQQYRRSLNQKDQQIHSLTITIEQLKLNFQKILVQSMRNAKNKVIESLPNLIHQSKTIKHFKYSNHQVHNI